MLALVLAAADAPPAAPPTGDVDNSTWGITLQGFLPGEAKGGTRNLNIYPWRENGRWVAAVCTASVQGKPIYNTMLPLADMTGITVKDGKVTGSLDVTMPADPWVPADGKPRKATIHLEATIGPPPGAKEFGSLSGTWKATFHGSDEELAAVTFERERSGSLTGAMGATAIDESPEQTITITLPNLLIGQANENFQRRRGFAIGFRGGKSVSVRVGEVDIRNALYDLRPLECTHAVTATREGFSGTLAFRFDTLDGEEADYAITFSGVRVQNMVNGAWQGTARRVGGTDQEAITGHLRGGIAPGMVDVNVVTDSRPWWVPVPGHVPVAPGEHPRLFFRKGDLPELRRRAATPEGQRIVARLKQLLGGGEALPKDFNPATKAYDDNKYKPVAGSYSISHAAGFAFLYQLSGDRKYAQLARECVELAWNGRRNFDDRYAWQAPGGELRAGPALGWYAVAYDLGYDGWDDGFRRTFALAIQDYKGTDAGDDGVEGKGEISLHYMVFQPRHGPSSNHYGAAAGGCGLAVLAIQGDPGTDAARVAKYDATLQRNIPRALGSMGFGDGGFFNEGMGPGQIFSDTAFVPWLQALRVAQGRDYINGPRKNVEWMTMLRVMELIGPPARYPYRSSMGGTYGSADFAKHRDGLSRGGQFAQGFGAVSDAVKPALLWTYNHVIGSADAAAPFDTPSLYPHRPMLALINWPLGVAERNPAELLPKVHRDSVWQYYLFRNRWQDADDIVVTTIINLPNGTKPRGTMVYGLGATVNEFGGPRIGAKPTGFAAGADGSGWIAAGGQALIVDYSKAAGCDALVVAARPPAAKPDGGKDAKPAKDAKPNPRVRTITVEAGAIAYDVLTLAADGTHPDAKADGDALVVGGQRIGFDGSAATLKVFTPAKK